jgi:hypothetical protein
MADFKVQINYKSGISMVIYCEKINVQWATDDSHVTSITWSGVIGPRPTMMGIHNIESVWVLEDRTLDAG